MGAGDVIKKKKKHAIVDQTVNDIIYARFNDNNNTMMMRRAT